MASTQVTIKELLAIALADNQGGLSRPLPDGSRQSLITRKALAKLFNESRPGRTRDGNKVAFNKAVRDLIEKGIVGADDAMIWTIPGAPELNARPIGREKMEAAD